MPYLAACSFGATYDQVLWATAFRIDLIDYAHAFAAATHAEAVTPRVFAPPCPTGRASSTRNQLIEFYAGRSQT